MVAVRNPVEIGLVVYPGVQEAAVLGLTDLFQLANRLAAERSPDALRLRVSHWQLEDASRTVVRTFDSESGDSEPSAGNEPAMIILPPTLGDPIAREAAAPYAGWLKARHAAGATLGSVCAGAFVLAETGLLSGRAATTHWAYRDALAMRFPDIALDADKLVIDDGDIITAGGYMAWTDLGLKFVDRVLGPTVMMDTARFMLVDPPGREQRFYSPFAPRLNHGDGAILKVQHWLQTRGARDVTLATMAEHAGLEERTFLRRFRNATGLKPTEYCQHLRVGKAREMLEATIRSIDQIAWDVGYDDPGSFRKVFARITGLVPGDYRRRFGVERAALPGGER
ncbi:GlxA family transcriptional regulator [Mesorhizobium sp. M9A.F.Ca.ET.002.03.1.2]|uniref:GlxA family transcriptional regulator n=1 Tax=Mesorhizobium sp. M9A.F.Ca.ET.002.03.1.2 TaxID=2493668 RepID=UPI000F74E53B|nr:GlxA family transcriptional regulator [Mesorhizobium sp. M9A.F.Ca.ET.002.03.1.2]AZN99134.1 GlxA family transcriptional regulator [Mesorhizobium sp. M9A.F.Ca.ET.002.03.1.2]